MSRSSSAHMGKVPLKLLRRGLGEDVIEEKTLQLHDEVIKQRLRNIGERQQQDVVQAERPAHIFFRLAIGTLA